VIVLESVTMRARARQRCTEFVEEWREDDVECVEHDGHH
jgi:hypothetical protein